MIIGLSVFSVIVGTINAIPHRVLKPSQQVTVLLEEAVPIKGSVEIKKGERLVAESQNKKLYLDTDTLHIRVEDKKTGKQWRSELAQPSNDKDRSVVNLTYLGQDNRKQEWHATRDVIEAGNYEINQLDNGVQLQLAFESTIRQLDQLIPTYVEERYLEERFYAAIDEKLAQEIISETQARSYKTILRRVYLRDLAGGGQGYKLTSPNALPPSGLRQINQMVQIIDYTEDEVREANQMMGYDIEIPPAPNFNITVNVVLEDDDLVVHVPTVESTTRSPYFKLQAIEVYPTFGAVSSEEVETGYIMVPDGAGALFELNSYDIAYPQYSRPVYDNTYYDQMYTMPQYNEILHMPVFGMTYGQDKEATHGFMGIIESGEALSHIHVQLGVKNRSDGGTINNKVYPSVDVMQYSRVKLMGPYSEDNSRYLASTGKIDMDYKVRYKFFGDEVTYFEMADAYKNYLMTRYDLETHYSQEPKMYLEILGALSVTERIVGIPYDKTLSMTTFEQAKEISNDFADMNLVLNYEGAFFGGEKTKLQNKVRRVKENGSEKELEDFIQTAQANNHKLFFGMELLSVKDTSYPFKAEVHGIYNYDSNPVRIYGYDYVTGKFSPEFTPLYRVHPKFFRAIVDGVLNEMETIEHLAINDIGNTYFASYKEGDSLTAIEANQMIAQGLEKLSENKTLAFRNPNMSVISHTNYAIDISRESSNYGSFYTTIPFRQLVLNGLVDYTTLDVNMSKKSVAYYLLQALELGSHPKFTISATKEDRLKDSEHRKYLSVWYETLKPTIEELYEAYDEAFQQIGTTEIKKHTVQEKNVFETEYVNGVKVLVNYNLYPVSVQGMQLEAMSYKIIR